MLPRFSAGPPDRCLIVGRFCEWHPNSQDYVVPDEGNDIRRARAELLRDLEKAGNAVPGDDWIIGQRIRYLVEAHDSFRYVPRMSSSRSGERSSQWQRVGEGISSSATEKALSAAAKFPLT